MKKIFLITLVILSFLPILAPSTQAQGSYSLWRRFTTKDGLADSDVQAIFADRKGNLWFGTANGLSRYDGSTWWKFTTEGLNRYDDGSWRTFQTEEALVDDNVQAIAQDADGNLWVGTFGGVSAFDRDRLIASYTFESTSRQGDQVTSVTTGAVAGGDEVPVKFADQTEADVALSSGYVMFGADLTFYRYKGYHTPAGSLVIEPALKEDISAGTLVYAVEVGLANNDVKAIAIDGKGGVWFGTEGGVSCLAPDGTWVTYTTWNSPLVENDVRAISKDGKGNLWFGTDGGGVSRLASDGSWETYTAEDGLGGDYVLAILRDRDDSLWFATTTFSEAHEYIGKGVSRRTADGTWRTYTTQDGLADDWVQALWQDQEGRLWFGTREGVSRLAPDGTWETYSTQNSLLPHNRIQAITEDAEGNLWFGTRRGAVRFNDRAWRTMPVGPDGLASSYVQALLRDRQGNLWFGTEGGGVSRLAPDRTWHTYTSESTQGGLIHDTVRAIAQDTGHNLWFGTDGGVSVFDGTAWTAHTVKSTSRRGDQVSTATAAAAPASSEVPVDFDNQARADHALASGYAMFGADLTVYEYRGYDQLTGTVALDPPLAQGVTPGTPVYAVERGLVSNSIWAIAVDGQVNVWFGTFEGVSRLAPDGTWKTYTVEDGLIHNRVRALLADREGNLWFGTDGGVSHFDGEWHDYPVPLQHPEDSQLAQNQIQAIFRDQEGNLWFGSRGGVHRLAPEAPPEDQWTTYTTREGLANKDVTAILQDSQGNLWFGTRGGGVSGLREGVFATLAIEDGLAADDVLAIAEDEDGVLWFATDGGGVSRHVPSRVPPQIRLAEILVNNQPRYTEAEGIPAEISLGYKERNGLRIVFGGGDLGTRPEDLQYFYRFREGGAWTPTSDPSVSRSLSPGTYIFCVRARDKDLNDSGPTEPLTIVVNAPNPWEAEWFPWLALTIAMVGPPGGVFAYRWYRRRQPKGYNDLELVIGPAEGAPEGHTVSAVWTAGRRRRRFEEEGKALDQGEVTSLLRKLEREEADEKLLRYLGERLFDALFTADLKEHLIKATGRGKKAVRLRLRFHDNVWLASLPWEYMYGGDNLRFLGTSPETAVTRYLSLEEQAGKLRASLPLKILVVIANPGNLSKLNLPPIEVGAERERLGRTLQPLAPQVELEFLVGASSGGDPISLTEALGLKLQEGYDVIHFSAHGDLEDGQGLLYLEDENGDYLRVYQGELSALFSGLAAQQAPKLIVLNACRTAASPGMGTLSGLAPALVMQGQVPAVVGMQFPISGDAAEIFSSHFYNALARHGQIDYAVSVARKAIAVEVGRDLRDWGIPVLYMQTADGIIFELP